MLRTVGSDGRDELEAGPDGPLRVVFLSDRGAPDRHHGVADELLDGAAVAPDDRPGELEVARQDLAHLLGVALLREGREADEVAEQHRDVAKLGGRRVSDPDRLGRLGRLGRSGPRGLDGGRSPDRRPAEAAESLARADLLTARGADGRERRSTVFAEQPAVGSVAPAR